MSWRYAVSKANHNDLIYRDKSGSRKFVDEIRLPSMRYTNSTSSNPQHHHHHHLHRSSDHSSALTKTTTARDLQQVLHYSITPCRTMPRLRRSEGTTFDVDCDEVFTKLYVGDAESARNKNFLRYMGITHVLNTAEGSRLGQVDTGHLYYRDMPSIRYMGFPLMDQSTTDISRYFYIASKFIENGLNSGGKVLVHCLMGVSRSATCAIVYLMIAKKMTATEAIRLVRLHREIRPNDGFLQQIADLDNELRRERLYSY